MQPIVSPTGDLAQENQNHLQALHELERRLRELIDEQGRRITSISDSVQQTRSDLAERITTAIEREREARMQADELIRKEAAENAKIQSERFGEIDEKLDGITLAFTEGMNGLAQAIDRLRSSIEVRDERQATLRKDVDALESAVKEYEQRFTAGETAQLQIHNGLRSLNVSIFGDASLTNAPPSVMKLLHDLTDEVRQGFRNGSNQMRTLTETLGVTTRRVDKLEEAKRLEVERWKARKELAIASLKAIAGSKRFWAFLSMIGFAIAAAISPELREQLWELVQIITQTP